MPIVRKRFDVEGAEINNKVENLKVFMRLEVCISENVLIK